MSYVLDLIAKPSVILLFAAAIAFALRRSSASLRHAVWILALAAAMVVPIASWVVRQVDTPTTMTLTVGAVYDRPISGGFDIVGGHRPPLQWIWLIGALVVAARYVLAILGIRALQKEKGDLEVLASLSAAFGIRRKVRLLIAEEQISPMTWGVFHPTILLPAGANDWPEERLRLVLAHELAHVKRHDSLLQLFLQVVCVAHWFNPLVWFAAHRVRIERERACDDRVLGLGIPAADYANQLVQVVRGLRNFSFASVTMAQPSQLESRLVSILDTSVRRSAVTKLGTVTLCFIAGLMTIAIGGIGVTAAAPPQQTRIGNETVPNNAITPARVIASTAPEYTPEAVRANIEGIVTLETDIDTDANVKVLRVIKGLGYGLDQKAIDAVSTWKFAPGLANGVPTRTITQVDVEFRVPPWFKQKPQEETAAVRVGAGVKPPTIVSRVEPQYTNEARDAKYSGTVVVTAVVHSDGTLTVEKVVRELEYGLTKSAIEALEQWKFKPGTKEGKPVPVSLNIEVNFNLEKNPKLMLDRPKQ